MAEKKEAYTHMERDFSKVILTLENVLLPLDKLSPTPSITDGLDSDTEFDLRILGCELIQTSGILLKLPQVAMATGQVLFQRFYFSKSFVKHNMEILAMACVNLASKIEEAPRRIRDVINVFHHIKQVRAGKTISPLILDQNYINLKNQVIKAERRVLKELGFCVHVKHPHKIIVMYMQVLECEKNQRFVQMAWNYMNDSFRTDVLVRHDPETIACACIYLSARRLQLPLPNNPPWYLVFCPHIDEGDLQEVSISILKLYERAKPNPDKLESVVNEAKKCHIEKKLKAKGLSSEGATPNSTSRPSTPVKMSPSSLQNSRKGKSEDDHSDGSFGKDLNHVSKKRHHSRSRSRSPSKSRSYQSSSRSHSVSRSPSPKRNKYKSPPQRKYKKESRRSRERDRYEKTSKRNRSNKKRSLSRSHSRSLSRSPERSKSKKFYKEKTKYRSRSRTPTRHKAKKHSSNGHRNRSRSRERYRR